MLTVWLVARRSVFVVPTLLGVLFLTFVLARIVPGDPTITALGQTATAEQRAEFRRVHRLDRPLYEQYVWYVGGILRGDLGRSLHTSRPVVRDIADLWPATLELATAALLTTLVIGVASGVLAARFKDRAGDHLARLVSLVGVSMPIFWLGLLMLLVFSLWWDLFPSGGRLSLALRAPPRITGSYLVDSVLTGQWASFRSAWHHLMLPMLCLSFAVVGIVSRLVRNSLLDVLNLDYIRTARAKGLSEASVLFRHALRNALLSVLTVSGVLYARLLGGAVLTETIFSWPGIGRYAADAILHLDYPSLLGVTVVSALVYVVVNLAVDVIYGVVDPRLRS